MGEEVSAGIPRAHGAGKTGGCAPEKEIFVAKVNPCSMRY